jgi:hypothetical protein
MQQSFMSIAVPAGAADLAQTIGSHDKDQP